MTDSAPGTPDPLVGTTLGERYLVQELVGEGGMGRVYLGQHVMMRKRIALKVIHPQLLHVEEVVARFEREAIAAGHIEHPNAVAATDFGRTADGSLYLVMEYVEGRRLDHCLTEQGRFGVARAVHVARQVLRALRRAHALGIVHRDIKPENVLLVERDGDPDFVKVLDFGIAKMTLPEGEAGTPLTQIGMVYGTPEYMSPEQATGSAVDARADLYSVGVLLFEMLAGRRPFAGGPVELLGQHVTAKVPSFADVAPEAHVPATLEALVQRLLAKLPEQRPESAREVLEALDDLDGAPSSGRGLAHAPTAAMPTGAGPGRGDPPLREAARTLTRVAGVEARRATRVLAERARRAPAVAAASGLAFVLVVIVLPVALLVGGADDEAAGPEGGAPGDAPPARPTPLRGPASSGQTAAAAHDAKPAPAPAALAGDAATPYSLGSTLADAGELVSAVAHYRSALQLRPALADDPKLQADIVRALGDRRAQEAAKALVREVLRARVADELAQAVGSNRPLLRRNARELLQEVVPAPEWPGHLRAIQELRAASGCGAKKAIIVRMREAGDPRVLPALVELREQRRGCGFLGLSDCNACLRPELATAISALQAGSRPDGS